MPAIFARTLSGLGSGTGAWQLSREGHEGHVEIQQRFDAFLLLSRMCLGAQRASVLCPEPPSPVGSFAPFFRLGCISLPLHSGCLPVSVPMCQAEPRLLVSAERLCAVGVLRGPAAQTPWSPEPGASGLSLCGSCVLPLSLSLACRSHIDGRCCPSGGLVVRTGATTRRSSCAGPEPTEQDSPQGGPGDCPVRPVGA